MKRYFYHGIEPHYSCLGHIVELMIKILDEGLKTRSEVRNFKEIDKYDHVCLYQKNDDFNYEQNDIKTILCSARSGWINNCFVFVVNPDIKARKAVVNIETNLVDEWRSIGDIQLKDIVGIALPYQFIEIVLKDNKNNLSEDRKLLREMLPVLERKATQLGIFITSSENPNFTDELDESLNKESEKKKLI